MGMSTYLEQHLLDLVFGAQAFTAPATVYVALSTTVVTNSAAPTEPSGSAYARVAVTNNLTNWPAATGNTPATKSNGTAITFPTATGAWGTATYFAIYDASTSGNLLGFGVLTTSQTIGNGDTASFAPGALVCTQN
jgi:hypothetical protein